MSRSRPAAPRLAFVPAAVLRAAVVPAAVILASVSLGAVSLTAAQARAAASPPASKQVGLNRGRISQAAATAVCRQPSPGSALAFGPRQAAVSAVVAPAPAVVTPAPAAPAPAAVIRVDQVGYPVGSAKLGEIMTTSSRPHGIRWVLVRRGRCQLAASGVATHDLGSWSKRYRWVWEVNFSAARQAAR